MNKIAHIFFFLTSILIYSCNENKDAFKSNSLNEKNYTINPDQKDKHLTLYRSEKVVEVDKRGKKKTEVMVYSINSIAALDFIARKGKTPKAEDIESLKEEQVLILEMELENEMQSVFESKRLQIKKNDVIEYINAKIINDIWVEQNGKEFTPKGHQYENSFGKQNRMRIYFYFKGINLKNNYRAIFNDRLYGSGLINFRIQANHDL